MSRRAAAPAGEDVDIGGDHNLGIVGIARAIGDDGLGEARFGKVSDEAEGEAPEAADPEADCIKTTSLIHVKARLRPAAWPAYHRLFCVGAARRHAAGRGV